MPIQAVMTRGGVAVEHEDEGDELLTPAEAAGRAKCSDKSIYKWSELGLIRRVKLGRLVRIRRSDLDDFIERNRS
jgi:excisionase family DNA binding protein